MNMVPGKKQCLNRYHLENNFLKAFLLTMKIYFIFLLNISTMIATAQKLIPLYNSNEVKGSIPCNRKEKIDTSGGRIHISHVTEPSLTIYRPANINKTRSAVIVCPGG